MRENRPYGSEGGESGSTGLPYPYRRAVATCRQTVEALLAPLPPLGSGWLRFGETLRNFDGDFRIELIDQIGPSSQRDWICDTSREAKLAKRKRYLPSEMKNLKQLGKDDGFGVPKRYTTLYEHPESNKSKRWDLEDIKKN